MLHFAMTVRNDCATSIKTRLEAGVTGPSALLYTLTMPTSPYGAAVTNQTLLATIVLAKPCCSVTDNIITFFTSDAVLCVGNGTASWVRLLDSDGNWVFDGVVGSDLTINNADLVTGGLVNVSGGTITFPA